MYACQFPTLFSDINKCVRKKGVCAYVPALKACQLNADVDMGISWTMMENLAQVGGKTIQTLPKDDTWNQFHFILYWCLTIYLNGHN